jgi:hypothetical protein
MFKLYRAYYRALEHPHQYITQHILDEEKRSLCQFGTAKWFWADINACNKSISTNTQLSMRRPCKNISHIQVLVTHFFPTPLIKLKLGLQVTWCENANSNPLGPINNQKQGAVNICNFDCVY